MTKVLESGTYTISSKQGGVYVGRSVHEDRTIRPKAVVSFPQGVPGPRWIVEKLPNDRYKLKANDAPTGVERDLVFAFLLDSPPAEEWAITYRENHDGAYTVEKADKSKGWVLPEETPYIQVAALLLEETESLQFPLNELWCFTRLDEE